jgi:AcrR family transcriptional regulator
MPKPSPSRDRLNRDRVLTAAVDFTDRCGLEAVSMRRLAAELDVVPMALYKHVTDKEELLDGMADLAISELGPLTPGTDWHHSIRNRILAARQVQRRHPWLRRVLETRRTQTPTMLAYIDSLIAAFRSGGFSIPLTHHVMHALGSRMWGFTQELFDDPNPGEPPSAEAVTALRAHFPNIAAVAAVAVHDDGTVVSHGCDDQFEFEFALDLLLDGFARLHQQDWRPPES